MLIDNQLPCLRFRLLNKLREMVHVATIAPKKCSAQGHSRHARSASDRTVPSLALRDRMWRLTIPRDEKVGGIWDYYPGNIDCGPDFQSGRKPAGLEIRPT